MDLSVFRYSQPQPPHGHPAYGSWSVEELPLLPGSQTLVLAFGAIEFGEDRTGGPLADLRRSYPEAIIAGCSTAGEIFGSDVQDHSVVVAALRFARCQIRQAFATISQPGESLQIGEQLAKELAAPDLRAILVFSDGTRVNGSRLVEGLRDAIPPGVVVSGGLAGDGVKFRQTWVLRDGFPGEGGVIAVGLYGAALRVAHGSKGGWDVFGPERVITRSEEHVLYELDGRPALDLYREYLGGLAAQLPGAAMRFPLSIRADSRHSERVVRTILSIDETARSMTFAGNLPQGHLARLMHAQHNQLVDGAAEASAEMMDMLGRTTGPVLGLAISCVGRRVVLGERTEEEVEVVLEGLLEGLSEGTPLIGFYSYGEISPSGPLSCDLHNQTMTLTAIGEDDEWL